MSVSGARSALATALATVTAFKHVHTSIPDSITQSPVAIVGDPDGQYDDTMNDTLLLSYPVYVIVGRQDPQRNQAEVEAFLDVSGSSSVAAAVEASSSLNGRVVRWENFGAGYTFGTETYVGVTLTVEVLA